MPNSRRFLTRPLYLQVRDVLAARITNGSWKAGGTIPNEIELARELEISVGTVRKALEQLEAERLVNRRQGRGTFVNDHSSDEMTNRFDKLRTPDGSRVRDQVSETEVQAGTATPEEVNRLSLRGGERVIRIKRVRLDGSKPYSVERSSLPEQRFSPSIGIGESQPSIVALALRAGILLARAEERISAVAADDEVAEQLAIPTATPLLKLDRVIFSIDGRPIEWRIAMCHTDGKYYYAEVG